MANKYFVDDSNWIARRGALLPIIKRNPLYASVVIRGLVEQSYAGPRRGRKGQVGGSMPRAAGLPETETQLAEPVKAYEHYDSAYANTASEQLRDQLIALKPKKSKILVKQRDAILAEIDKLNDQIEKEFNLATDNAAKGFYEVEDSDPQNPHVLLHNELSKQRADKWDAYSIVAGKIGKNDKYYRDEQMRLLKKYALKIPKARGNYILGDDIKSHTSAIGKFNFDTHTREQASDTDKIEESVKEGLKFIDTMVPYSFPDFEVHLTDTDRPHYHHLGTPKLDGKFRTGDEVRKLPGEIHIFPDRNTATVVHELTHHVVAANPVVKDQQLHFWMSRTKDEPVKKMVDLQPNAGYEDNELSKPDHFDNPYSGKFYADDNNETLSMGMEAMYRDPSEFAKKDPDYFHFVARFMWKWQY